MDSNDIFSLADQLVALKEDKARLEERLKKLNGFIDEVDYKLTEAMAEADTRNFTRGDRMFFLTCKTRASAVADRKDALFEALRENGFGDLVTETVNANSLSSFVKEQMEESEGDTLPEWLGDLVNVYEKTSVSIRKSTKKEK